MNAPLGFDSIRLALAEGYPPKWASGWGEDGYGVFLEFTIEKVTQRLRWIPSGSFLMGSPDNEPGRSEYEGPQHEVTFQYGFWLFDTACTQELWQVVMGDNPSGFKDSPKQPVENVSWHAVRDFIAKINLLIPGLQLTLPSESQWEYACRAGTTTPFSFGENITAEQVNYDGNVPYADGLKGECRNKTVAVATLPANGWGLYEMHGNVWEWCEDEWHDSYKGATIDGQAWISSEPDDLPGAKRVIRGGSWFYVARSVRGACRYRDPPDFRSGYLGFRCSRVQE
ncbi:MAG: formylglycine-generating enzyme family protein [Magnetococcales bacterium]|nr:formylglycine-generating enzyme family protein [Magnetococcales bacterium]